MVISPSTDSPFDLRESTSERSDVADRDRLPLPGGPVRPRRDGNIDVIREVLLAAGAPISVRKIIELAGGRLCTQSRTPSNVIARDLAMEIIRNRDASEFVRTAPGRYTLRALRDTGRS